MAAALGFAALAAPMSSLASRNQLLVTGFGRFVTAKRAEIEEKTD